MGDYSIFFTDIVARHLHELVDMVKHSHRQKILLHQWILGIEHNWPDYVQISDNESEFVPRLSIWIGGLRDRFNSSPTKQEVIEMLAETFDASTFCFFEYGARKDILNQIERYVNDVDEYFDEDVLNHRFKKFILSQKIVYVLNEAFDKLIELGVSPDDLNQIPISKDIDTASELEKEFTKLIENVLKLAISSVSVFRRKAMYDYLTEFLDRCKEVEYDMSVLYVKLTNIFGLGIKNVDMRLKVGKLELQDKTDRRGMIVFMDIQKGNATISFNRSKQKLYTFEINKKFNKKLIWTFSF